jgi:hypothetical protein
MKKIATIQELTQLDLGAKLYRATSTQVKWWYYAGINPLSSNSIMLISSGNIQEIHGEWTDNGIIREPFFITYEDVCAQLLLNAQENVLSIKRIYIDRQQTNNS